MDPPDKPMGQMHASRPDSDQCEILHTLVSLKDFVGNTRNGAGDIAPVHHKFFFPSFSFSAAIHRHNRLNQLLAPSSQPLTPKKQAES